MENGVSRCITTRKTVKAKSCSPASLRELTPVLARLELKAFKSQPTIMFKCLCCLPFFQSRSFSPPNSPRHPLLHHTRQVHMAQGDCGPDGHHPHHNHNHHPDHVHGGAPEHCGEPEPAAPECSREVDANAALKALAGESEGFGRDARGGADGRVYVVTSLEDDESCEGTLRHGCAKEEPLWIVFGVSGTICLSCPLPVSSHKTIDGRGQKVTISGHGGLKVKEVEHVIICNLNFECGSGSDADAIQIKPCSKHIWVDRCTLTDYADGLIDITRASTDITVSRCRFLNHDKAFLIGADPNHVDDRCIRVTIHHCFFDCNKQYQPRVRFGKIHLYNNYTRNWGSYAVCAGVESQIFSQSCVYEAGEKNKKKAFKYDCEKAGDREVEEAGSVRSEGDVFLNGAAGDVQGAECVFDPKEYYPHWTLECADDALAERVCANAGWQDVCLPPYAS